MIVNSLSFPSKLSLFYNENKNIQFGYFISYKSDKVTEEFEHAGKAIKTLGGVYQSQVEFYLPNSDIYRNLFIIKKENTTPGKYPRKAGLPSKEPIM